MQVDHYFHRDGRELVTVRLLHGQVDTGMQLEAIETGAHWRVVGVGFMSSEGWAQGLRSLILQALDGPENRPKALHEGTLLQVIG